MTTQEIADKLVALCREGKFNEAYNILEGFKQWGEIIQETHGGSVGDPVVVGNHFTVPMTSDVTFKDGNRINMEEICLYQVKNGKITKASFHYDTSMMG